MKKMLLITSFSLALLQCTTEDAPEKVICSDCYAGTPATIRDLTGLDGCGFVFELNDSTRLEPVRVFSCGTPSSPDIVLLDPLANFDVVDGKKVFINYTVIEGYVSTCMVGQGVRITCIKEDAIDAPSE